MEMSVNIQHGPLDAEFTGDDREEIEEDLLGFLKFLDENDHAFDGLQFEPRHAGQNNGSTNGSNGQVGSNGDSPDESNGSQSATEHPLGAIARQIGVSVDTLDEIIYADPDGEENPQLLIDKNELGSSKAERQRHAAYLLLLVWEKVYGEERMKNSNLKKILSIADISDNNLHNAWGGSGKGKLETTGRGASATVGLTGPGEREAIKFLKELAEDFEE